MKRKIHEIISANNSFKKIFDEKKEYSINILYKIHKFKKQLDEVENITLEKINFIFGDEFDFSNLKTDIEKSTYIAIMEQEVDLENPEFDLKDIINNENVKLNYESFKQLESFINHN